MKILELYFYVYLTHMYHTFIFWKPRKWNAHQKQTGETTNAQNIHNETKTNYFHSYLLFRFGFICLCFFFFFFINAMMSVCVSYMIFEWIKVWIDFDMKFQKKNQILSRAAHKIIRWKNVSTDFSSLILHMLAISFSQSSHLFL